MNPLALPFFLAAALCGMATSAQTSATPAERRAAQDSPRATLDEPTAGWRQGRNAEAFLQEVHYPANPVNVGQGQHAAIRGRIARDVAAQAKQPARGGAQAGGRSAATSGSPPARLVVNGVAMPLSVDEDGRFGRPWAFGQGSNSVELRSPQGQVLLRRQFYDANASKTAARLRVVLNWDSDGTDLDLHVISPSGQHAFYGNRVIAGGGALDVDVTTGYGPEIFATPAPEKGLWQIYVNYYGSGLNKDAITTAQVAIITQENTPHEKQQVFNVPMRKAGDLTLVRSFSYP